MKLSYALIGIALLTVPDVSHAGHPATTSTRPRVFQIRPSVLTHAAGLAGEGNREARALIAQIRANADKALSLTPPSVMDKKTPLPGADRHDFVCPAPLWWPDPDQEDGLPYVWNREGKINPEYYSIGDQVAFDRMSDAVEVLALAFSLTGDENYDRHASLLARTWFLGPKTRMNPNLNHAWFEKGRNSGTAFGIMAMERLPAVIDAIGLLGASWGADDQQSMLQWVAAYGTWLRTTDLGRDAGKVWNRFGTQYDVQLAACALFTGDSTLARSVIEASKRERIDRHIRRDGRQPYELEREITFGNTAASLRFLFALATMGERVGIDLWNYVGCEGGSIRRALDLIAPYADPTETWPYPLEVDRSLLRPILLQAAVAYDDDEYARLVARLPEERDGAQHAYALYALDVSHRVQGPRTFIYDHQVLNDARTRIARGDTTFTQALHVVLDDARTALQRKATSVMDKKLPPPSGDKHDFMSVGGYYWPDTTKPGGLPWIYRDGKVNPAIAEYGDFDNFSALMRGVRVLGVAYSMTGDERYADHASMLLRVWFLDPATRMNPHLRYAHAQPGVFDGSYYGIIQTGELPGVIDAIGLLSGSRTWTQGDQDGMVHWAVRFLDWMLHDEDAQEASRVWNNHSVNYDVTAVSLALFSGRRGIARRLLERVKTERIARQIREDGRLPFELERNRAWGYAAATLERFARLATMGSHVGVDLWNYESPGGSSIRKCIDYMARYAEPGAQWPYADYDFERYGTTPLARIRPILQRALLAYHDQRYGKLALALPDNEDIMRSQDPGFLFYPTEDRSNR